MTFFLRMWFFVSVGCLLSTAVMGLFHMHLNLANKLFIGISLAGLTVGMITRAYQR